MLFKQDKFRKVLLITVILVFIIGVFYYLFEDSKAQAFNTEQIKIFPSSYTGDWENPQAAFIQDLNETADFNEFNMENSAYLILNKSEQELIPESSEPVEPTDPVELIEPSIPSGSTTSTPVELIEPSMPSGSTTSTPEASRSIFLASFWQKIRGFLKINIAKAQEVPVVISNKTLEFYEFGIANGFQDKEIVNVQLRLSLAGKTESVDNKISIEYSQNNVWQSLDNVILSPEISNALNGGYWLYTLPVFQSWEDFNNLKIRFSVDPCQESETLCDFAVYLNSLWLEVNYEENGQLASLGSSISEPSLQSPKIIPSKLITGKKSFKNNEDPVFELPQKPNLKVKKIYLIGAQGEETGVEIILQKNIIKVKKPRVFKPGKYTIQIQVEEDGEAYIIEQEFMWGVLAININKSIYLPNEQAYLQMGALRDDGNTLCDANLKLEITNPSGQITYPQVEKSGLCKGNNVVDVPDYFAYYTVSGTGEYQMKLTNLDNDYEIVDSFEVWESVPFDIERIGPTRIYPPAVYQVEFNIIPGQDFTGQVIESMPAGFVVITDETAKVVVQDDTKQIIWSVDWHAKEIYKLTYQFDAPNISPYLYLLGPLEFHD